MQSAIESLKRLKDPKSKVSCHYFIDNKGVIIQLVKDNKIAWHAGKSKWKNYRNLNDLSIGIELQNKGHKFGYKNFPNSQLNSFIKLSKKLKKKYLIKSCNFLGHSDIAPLRKKDPGEKFPWEKLSKYKIGTWFKETKREQKPSSKNVINLFFRNIHKIGYRYFNLNKRNKNDQKNY